MHSSYNCELWLARAIHCLSLFVYFHNMEKPETPGCDPDADPLERGWPFRVVSLSSKPWTLSPEPLNINLTPRYLHPSFWSFSLDLAEGAHSPESHRQTRTAGRSFNSHQLGISGWKRGREVVRRRDTVLLRFQQWFAICFGKVSMLEKISATLNPRMYRLLGMTCFSWRSSGWLLGLWLFVFLYVL